VKGKKNSAQKEQPGNVQKSVALWSNYLSTCVSYENSLECILFVTGVVVSTCVFVKMWVSFDGLRVNILYVCLQTNYICRPSYLMYICLCAQSLYGV